MARLVSKAVWALVALAVLGAAAYWFLGNKPTATANFRLVQAARGDLKATISATGTVEPEELVDVGAQVAGRILGFGRDTLGNQVDYGSPVEADTVLARIDDALYAADLRSTTAQLEQAKAGLAKAQADLGQYKARLAQAQRDWARAQKLGPSEALAQADYDAALSAQEVAAANLEVGKAAVAQAQATVLQAEAARQRSQQNLDYCTIRSPVRGVIIDRRVNIGQTVVASLSAPSLFLIAKDLNQLQIWVSVNEADIKSIHPGQAVEFEVDALPGEVFPGTVGKVRLNATMTQNVVTYTVEVHTDNPEGKLLPYLTANVRFLLDQRRGVLLLPNAALRWTPRPELMAQPAERKPQGRSEAGQAGQEEQSAWRRGTVWVEQDGKAKAVPVMVGLTDGSLSEIKSRQLKEGDLVIAGEEVANNNQAATPAGASPFTPRISRGGRH